LCRFFDIFDENYDALMIRIEDDFIEVLGKKLFVRKLITNSERDSAEMVFLHEGLGCIEFWKDFPLKLLEATGLNAVVFDRQGYGKSEIHDLPRPDHYLQTEAFDFLPALLEKLEIRKPVLIGHSDGATIALLHASKYADRLVLAESAHVYVEDITIEGIQAATDAYDIGMFEKLEKYHGDKAEEVFRSWSDTWLRESFRSWNVSRELYRIECPCLLLQGRNDEYASEEQFKSIMNGIGGKTEGYILENCGHSPHIQAKEITFRMMSEFILKHV
jgi:pimeloyl-ACP methyl ester carboxylesterase